MTDSESRRWLYDQAKNKGVDLGDYDAFDKAMDDANNRKWVYDQATQKGLDLGDYDAYDKAIGPAPAPKSTKKEKEYPISDIRNPKNIMRQPDDFTPPEGMDWETNPDTAVAETTSTRKPQIQDPIRTSYNPVADEVQPTSPLQAMVEDLSRVNAINQELETARARKNRTAGAYQIEEEAYGPVLPRNSSFQKEAKENVKKLEAEKKQLMARLDMNPEYRKHISEEADAVVEKKNEALEALEALGPADSRMIIGGPGLPPMPSFSSDQAERDDFDAALRLYDDAEKMLRSPFKYDDSNGWANHFKGVGDRVKDPDFWTMGLTEIVDLVALRNVLKKVENEADRLGEKGIDAMTEDDADLSFLNAGEQALFDAFFTNLNARRMRADDMSSGYKSGQTAADSAKFMVEMGYSGIVGKAASKGMTKYLTKKLASRLVNMNTKSLGYKAAKELGGFAIKKGEHLVRTAVGLPLTPEMPLGTLRRATELDESGRLPKIDAKLVANGTLDSALEYFTEQGSVVADGLKAFGKFVPVGQWASSFIGKDATQFIRSISRADMARLMKQGAWNGFIDEGLEEFDNAIYDYLRGNPDAISDFLSVDNLLELSASFAGMSVMGTAGSAAQVAQANFDYNRAEKDLRDMMAKKGYSEDQIQHIIDIANGNSSLSELGGALTMVVNGQAGAGAVTEMRGRLGSTTEDFKVVKDYMDAAARRAALRGLQESEQDERIENERQAIQQELGGHQFWQERTTGQSTTENVVIAQVRANPNAGLQEGQTVFLTSTPDPASGEMGYVTEDGRTGFIKADGIIPVQMNGVNAMAVERPLREYLSYRVMTRDAQDEQQDFAEQRNEQVQQLAQQYQVEDVVNIDGMEGTVVGSNADGIQVSFVDDNGREIVRPYTWEEVAQKQGTPMQVQTEEEEIAGEIGEQEAMRQNTERVAQVIRDRKDDLAFEDNGVTYTVRDENPVKAGSVTQDGMVTVNFVGSDGSSRSLVLDTKDLAAARQAESPAAEAPQAPQYEIPRTKSGEIDYDKLMEENPAEFARVNDEEMQDDGASTQTLFNNRVAELEKELKKNQANLAKQSKPSEMKKYQRKVADIQEKIAKLQSVLDGYKPVEEAPVEAVAEPAQEVVETPEELPVTPEIDIDMNEPLSIQELASMLFTPNMKGTLNKEDFMKHLGWGEKEASKFFMFWAKKGKGKTVDRLAEELVVMDEENGYNFIPYDRNADQKDTSVARNAILEVLSEAYSPSDLFNYVKNANRKRMEEMQSFYQGGAEAEQAALEYEARRYGLTVSAYQRLIELAEEYGVGTDEMYDELVYGDRFEEKYNSDLPWTDEEAAEYDNLVAEEIFEREQYESENENQGPEGVDGGNSEESGSEVPDGADAGREVAESGETGEAVLPGEQPDNGGTGADVAVPEAGGESVGREEAGEDVPAGDVQGAESEVEDALGENETQEIRDAVDAIVSGKDKKKRELNDRLPADYTIAGKDANSYIRDRYDRFKAPLEERREEIRKQYVAYRSRVEEQAKADILAKNPHIKEDNPHLPDYVSEEADKRLKNDSEFNALDAQIKAIDEEIGKFQERRYNALAAISEIYAKNAAAAEEAVPESADVENIPEMPEELQEEAAEAEEAVEEEQPVAEEEAPQEEANRELTEDEIRNSGYPDTDMIDAAVDYIKGNTGFAETIAYNEIKEYVRSQHTTTEPSGRDANATQLDGGVVQTAGVGAEQRGSETDGLDTVQDGGQVGGNQVPENGGVSSGKGSTASAQGEGLQTDVPDSGSKRRGRRDRTAESGQQRNDDGEGQGGSEVTPEQTPQRGTEAGSVDIDALGGELDDLLNQFQDTNYSVSRRTGDLDAVSYSTSPEKGEEGALSRKRVKTKTAPLSLEGMTPKQMQLAGKILFTSAKLGYAYAKSEGLTSFNDFSRWFKGKFGNAVMKGLNYDESTLEAFINEVWNTKLNIDGNRLSLQQHASEIKNSELREKGKLTNKEREQLQKAANKKKITPIPANRKNISESLPMLIPGQWDDIVGIERQFFDESHNDYDHAFGKGMLITNGTGTGKTFTGLGTIKRFVDMGKGRVLVVCPASMTNEWSDKANLLGIKMTKLENTKDKGKGVVVTSYENFRDNRALYEDEFDLVVYDECQNIIENQKGDDTLAYEAHKRITNKNVDEATDRLVANTESGRRKYDLEEEKKSLEREMKKKSTKQSRRDDIVIRLDEIERELTLLNDEIELLKPMFREKAEASVKKTKVLLLSATPFNTVENLKIAEGYIFQYPKVFRSNGTEVKDEQSRASAFVTEWFRGDEPMEELEVAFGDHLLDELETASFRELENGFDHSRDFPDISGNVMASRFNAAWQAVQAGPLQKVASFLTDPVYTTQLFEVMKISALRSRLKEHLDAGRKIVIFHDRVHESKVTEQRPPVGPPFQTLLDIAMKNSSGPDGAAIMMAVANFKRQFQDILDWEQTLDYRPVHEQVIDFYATQADRDQYAKEMAAYNDKLKKWQQDCEDFIKTHPTLTPEELQEQMPKAPKEPKLKAESVAVYNGECSNKEKEEAKASFNDDNSKTRIICVTTRSGGAGLSLHDTTGKFPRVMIQTALPLSPIGFIQAEGRIFRWGNRSNAIFEYPRLGIDLEQIVFALSFNKKAETVENLGHGFRGRGLKESIRTGFIENSGNVPIAGQGIGGVELDRRGNALKGMARAKHDYGVVKRKGTKEGDTSVPEPVGYMMAQWSKAVSGDTALIPFAGRGSVARYIEKGVATSAMEENISLQSDLALAAGGADFKIKEGKFGELNAINKADVVILSGANDEMTTSSLGSFEKGFQHLAEGGRLVAVVPDNSRTDESIAKLGDAAALRATIKVGVGVLDGNKEPMRIVIIDRVSKAAMRDSLPKPTVTDLTSVDQEKLFNLIEKINVPDRAIDVQYIKIKKIKAVGSELKKSPFVDEFAVDDSGYRPYFYIHWGRMPKGFARANWDFSQLYIGSHWAQSDKYESVRLSSFENPNQYNTYIQKYMVLKDLLEMPDEEFRNWAEIEEGASKENVDAFRDMFRLYAKLFRAAFNLTDTQIQRVARGLRADVSASDIDTLNNYEELKAKFEACNHDDQERQDLYDKVEKVAKQIGLTIGAESMDRDFLGGYNNVLNTLKINKLRWNGLSDDERATTLLHELIHSISVYALAGYDTDAPGMSDELYQAAQLAYSVYSQITVGDATDVRPFTGQYAIENAKELLAEMANPETREKLKNRRLWIKKSARGLRVFGGEVEDAEQTTAWDLLNEALDGILKHFDKNLFDRFKGRVSDFIWKIDRNGNRYREADDVAESRPSDIAESTPVEVEREADKIYAKALLNGTLGIAPNGEKPNLSNEQWALVRTSAFKRWFGDWENDPENSSKIVDENGEPRVVYHGTKKPFWVFDGGKNHGVFTDGLNYFALDREFADRWATRDDDERRPEELNQRLKEAKEKVRDYRREVEEPEWEALREKYGKDYWKTDEATELYRRHEEARKQWERENLDLDGMEYDEATYSLGKRILPVFINSRNPYNPAEMYDTVGKEMLQRLGVLGENPSRDDEYYARGGSYLYYERKAVVDELKKMGYDSIYLSENVWSDPSKNLRTLAVWDSNRIKLAEPTTYDDNGNEIPIDDRFSGDNDDIRYRRGDGTVNNEDTTGIESAVNEAAEKLNTPVVIEHGTPAGVKKDSLGWYDPNDGSVHVNVDAARSPADAIATVLHETVGHHGLRTLLGDKFDKSLQTLRSMATKEIREKIDAIAKEQGVDELTAMEEYLAQLAEQGATNNEELSFWEQAKQFLRNLLRSIGINVGEITEADLNYLIWASRRNLEQNGGDLLRAADNAIIRGAMKRMAQDSHEVQRETPERLYRTFDDYKKASVRSQYDTLIKNWKFQSAEGLQDSMLSLKKAMQMIIKEETEKDVNIEDIPGFENAYLAENRNSSMNEQQIKAMERDFADPLDDEVARLVNGESDKNKPMQEKLQDLFDYMMAKHGLERNEKFAQRDAIQFYRNLMDATIEAAKKDKSLDDDARAEAIDAAEAEFEAHKQEIEAGEDKKYKEFRKKDYSGLTALTKNDNVSDAESKAKDMVRDYEFDHDTERLWKLTKALSDDIIRKANESGTLTKEKAKEIRDMFEYYIPLRGFDETTSDEAYAYLDDAHGPLNSPILRAGGRKTKADDPVSNLINMAIVGIMQGNRNILRQNFLNFVLNHPSDLFSVSELWLQKNPITDEWEAVFADLDEKDPPAIVEKKIQEFEERMKELAENDPENYKRGKDAKNIPYIVINNHQKEHQIIVKRLGKTYVITVNGDPRIAQAINGLNNPDGGKLLGIADDFFGRGTRFLSNVYTTRNPEFVASNFARDIAYTSSLIWVKEPASYARAFEKNLAKLNPVKLKNLFVKHESGKLNMSDPLEKAFYDFMMNGGETGYTSIKNIEQQKKELAKHIKKNARKYTAANDALSALSAVGSAMDLLNRSVENCARFAAFITSRESGRSLERSIWDAKDISVNFNKKGAGATYRKGVNQTTIGKLVGDVSGLGRILYPFWNASVQGVENLGRQGFRNPLGFGTLSVALLSLGALMPVLSKFIFGGDDDDKDGSYFDLPEYTRRSNLTLGAGKTFVTIPLPVEYRALYGIGELVSSALIGEETYSDMSFGVSMLSQISQILPIDMLEGGGGLHAFTPGLAKPLREVEKNKKWNGLPIYKEDTPWNEHAPEWEKTFKSTNKTLVEITKALNTATNEYHDPHIKGLIDLNPAKIEYLLNGYLGGYAVVPQMLLKGAEMRHDIFKTISESEAETLWGRMREGDKEYDVNNELIARRFVKQADEAMQSRTLNNEYYKFRDEYEKMKPRVADWKKTAQGEKLEKFYSSPEYRIYQMFELFEPQIEKAKREVNEAKKKGNEASIEAKQKVLNQKMQALVDAIRNADKKEKGKD